jgi:AcrR family transcriptional regulator
MPKIVDHDEQRGQIASAAVEWIALHGVETLSQRNLAAITGRSKGNVQHYFPDKASLMLAALKRITEVRVAREKVLADDPYEALSERLFAVLPTNEDRAKEWRVRLSLYLYAANAPDMQAFLVEHAAEIEVRGTADVQRCQAAGKIDPALDPVCTARRLSAAVSGIAVAALATGGKLNACEQRAVLADVLEAIRLPKS